MQPMQSALGPKRWFVENRLGVSPSFLERCLKRDVEARAVQTLPVSECSSMFIQALSPLGGHSVRLHGHMCMHVHGYQKHSRFHSAIEMSAELAVRNNALVLVNPLDTRLGIFSCHNEIALCVFLSSGRSVETYYASFFPCRLLRRHEVFLKKLHVKSPGSFFAVDETPSYKMDVRVFSSRELHYNWEDPVERPSGGAFSFAFEDAVYTLASIRCMFCFKERASVESLREHLAHVHMHYRAVLCNGHVSERRSAGPCTEPRNAQRDSAARCTVKIIPVSGGAPQKTRNRFYFCRRRRSIDRSRMHTFPYTNYFEPETLEPLGAKKLFFPWQKWLVGKRLDEIIDLPEEQVRIIKEWNIFMQEKKVRPSSRNILCYVKEFVGMHDPSFEMLMFITCLYNNAVLSIEEVCEVVMERVL